MALNAAPLLHRTDAIDGKVRDGTHRICIDGFVQDDIRSTLSRKEAP